MKPHCHESRHEFGDVLNDLKAVSVLCQKRNEAGNQAPKVFLFHLRDAPDWKVTAEEGALF